MSTLAETYALGVGVQLSRPDMADAFYPLDHPLGKTVLIHAFAGATTNQNGQLVATFPSKLYSHFNEVVTLLKPVIEAAGYRIYQIGGPGEPVLKGIESLAGKTTIHQCAYLVKGCALLIGNDSIWAHVRGAYGGSQVQIYGSTSRPHFPHWNNPAVCSYIESHRGGKKPSYSAIEGPKTIDWIPPERIAGDALSILGLGTLAHRTFYIGEQYNQPVVELVPNIVIAPHISLNTAPIIRADYFLNEQALAANIQLRKCSIITDKAIDLNLLAQLKPNIASMRVEVDRLDPAWIKTVRKLGIPIGLFASQTDPEKLRQLRLDLYDACAPSGFDNFVPPTREDFMKGAAIYLNKELDSTFKADTLRFKTSKFLLSENKVFLSKAHWKAGKDTPSTDQNSAEVIDTADFWEESAHHFYYTD